MSKSNYAKLNNLVMGIVYSPFLVIIAWVESRCAHKVRANRARGEEDDDETEEWEELQGEVDILGDGWEKQVAEGVPDVDKDPAVVEVLMLRSEIEELKTLIQQLGEGKEGEPSSPTEE